MPISVVRSGERVMSKLAEVPALRQLDSSKKTASQLTTAIRKRKPGRYQAVDMGEVTLLKNSSFPNPKIGWHSWLRYSWVGPGYSFRATCSQLNLGASLPTEALFSPCQGPLPLSSAPFQPGSQRGCPCPSPTVVRALQLTLMG